MLEEELELSNQEVGGCSQEGGGFNSELPMGLELIGRALESTGDRTRAQDQQGWTVENQVPKVKFTGGTKGVDSAL